MLLASVNGATPPSPILKYVVIVASSLASALGAFSQHNGSYLSCCSTLSSKLMGNIMLTDRLFFQMTWCAMVKDFVLHLVMTAKQVMGRRHGRLCCNLDKQKRVAWSRVQPVGQLGVIQEQALQSKGRRACVHEQMVQGGQWEGANARAPLETTMCFPRPRIH